MDKLDTAPIRIKSATCAVLNLIGDTFAQYAEYYFQGASSFYEAYSPKRALSFATTGLFYIGPLIHFSTSKLLPRIALIGGNTYQALKKVVFDQVIA